MNKQKKLYYNEIQEIPSHYIFVQDETINISGVKSIQLIEGGCISLLLLDKENNYFLYYPFDSEDQLIPTTFENDDLVDGETAIDCFGNRWVVENENLHYFIKTLEYEESSDFQTIFKGENEYTIWSTLDIKWNLPKGKDIEIKVEVRVDDGAVETFINMSNILLYDYQGKELHVKVTLKSDTNQRLTPSIYSMQVILNQKPYIDYLPAYYQKDKEVLSRYLSIFQNIMGEFEEKIDKSVEMLNPLSCDEEYLEWLSSLLGINRDYRWEEKRWREFLAQAPSLYEGLGTKKSMQDAIELYCGEKPEIKDDYADKLWTFCVKLSEEKIKSYRDIEVIESIIQAFKPAHTNGRLLIGYEKEAFIVGSSSLAINTQIQ